MSGEINAPSTDDLAPALQRLWTFSAKLEALKAALHSGYRSVRLFTITPEPDAAQSSVVNLSLALSDEGAALVRMAQTGCLDVEGIDRVLLVLLAGDMGAASPDWAANLNLLDREAGDDWESRLDALAVERAKMHALDLGKFRWRRQSAFDLAKHALKVLLRRIQRLFFIEERIDSVATDPLQARQGIVAGDSRLVGEGEDQAAVDLDLAGKGNDLVRQTRGGAIIHLSSPVGSHNNREPHPGESEQNARPAGVDGGAAS
ncbi:MAG: hypothetical protein KF842_06890 [Caulobacter sp.]|nr:hypothetical protein [Caulobacter sp.]